MKFNEIELQLADPKSQLSTVRDFWKLRWLIYRFNKAKSYQRKYENIVNEIDRDKNSNFPWSVISVVGIMGCMFFCMLAAFHLIFPLIGIVFGIIGGFGIYKDINKN